MKNKQEQIEEMAKTMCEEYGTAICQHECENLGDCANSYLSKKLYEAGYRKATEVIDEFMERLRELLNKHEYRSQTDGIPFYQMNAESFCDELNEIADEMRKEVKK